MKIVQRTNIGHRASNEDSCLVETSSHSALIAVSDGMGGHVAGKVASELTTATLRECFAAQVPTAADFFARTFAVCNQAVWDVACADSALRGMGATLVAAMLYADRYEAANVGDSRLYHFSAGQLCQVSHDHSYVGELVRLGIIEPEAALRHPKRNVILRAIGTEETIETDIFSGLWAEGDILLLCSDGLHNHVSNAQMIECFTSGEPLETLAEELITKALTLGARDNISVVLACHEGGAA